MGLPAQALIDNKKSNTNPKSVQFPADLGSFYFSIDFYDYRTVAGASESKVNEQNTQLQNAPFAKLFNADKTSVNNQIAKPTSFNKIKLPLPNQLVDSFRMDYGQDKFGVAGGVINTVVNAVEAGKDVFDGKGLGSISGEDFKSAALTAGHIAADYATKTNLLGVDVAGLYQLATGTVVNPNLAVLFRGPTLKSHTFKWRFTPRNKTETESVRQIIAIIKRAMHPSRVTDKNASILRYPSECLIQFCSPKSDGTMFLYPLRPTIVDSFDVNYGPNGSPTLFQETFEPTSIEITIGFQETSYYTRESFDNSFEYGSDGFSTVGLSRYKSTLPFSATPVDFSQFDGLGTADRAAPAFSSDDSNDPVVQAALKHNIGVDNFY